MVARMQAHSAEVLVLSAWFRAGHGHTDVVDAQGGWRHWLIPLRSEMNRFKAGGRVARALRKKSFFDPGDGSKLFEVFGTPNGRQPAAFKVLVESWAAAV